MLVSGAAFVGHKTAMLIKTECPRVLFVDGNFVQVISLEPEVEQFFAITLSEKGRSDKKHFQLLPVYPHKSYRLPVLIKGRDQMLNFAQSFGNIIFNAKSLRW